MRDNGVNAGLCEKRVETERHVCAVPHFGDRHRKRERQPLAAVSFRNRQAAPAAGDPLMVSVGKTVRHDDFAVDKPRALHVSGPVGWGQFLIGKPRSLLQNRHRGVHIQIFEQAALDKLRKSCDMIERESNVCDGRAISHWSSHNVRWLEMIRLCRRNYAVRHRRG